MRNRVSRAVGNLYDERQLLKIINHLPPPVTSHG